MELYNKSLNEKKKDSEVFLKLYYSNFTHKNNRLNLENSITGLI